jgi:hypothetical protein
MWKSAWALVLNELNEAVADEHTFVLQSGHLFFPETDIRVPVTAKVIVSYAAQIGWTAFLAALLRS